MKLPNFTRPLYGVGEAWFRRRTFHVPNLTEYVRLWSDTGARSDSDDAPCVEPKLSSTDSVELNAFAAPN